MIKKSRKKVWLHNEWKRSPLEKSSYFSYVPYKHTNIHEYTFYWSENVFCEMQNFKILYLVDFLPFIYTKYLKNTNKMIRVFEHTSYSFVA